MSQIFLDEIILSYRKWCLVNNMYWISRNFSWPNKGNPVLFKIVWSMIFSAEQIKMIVVVVVGSYDLWVSTWWYQKEKIDANHNWVLRGLRIRSYALPTGFHADIIIRRSSGLFLILSITVANWSTPWPLYSACMLMYLAPKWRHWNPYTGPRSPSSRSCKPKQKLHWDVDHEQ